MNTKRLFQIPTTLALVIVAALSVLSVKAALPSLSDRLVGSWDFNGDSLDDSGNQNHATRQGAAFGPDRFGRDGHALVFDGVDDFVDLGRLGIVNEDFTVSSWFRVDSLKWHTIFSENHGELDRGILLAIQNDQGRMWFVAEDQNHNQTALQANQSPALGSWHHIGAVRDGQLLSLYLDGQLIGQQTIQTWQTTSISNSAKLGVQSDAGNHWFQGSIDDVEIYDTALTPEEIESCYLLGQRLPPDRIVGSVGMEMMRMAAGTFRMGSPSTEQDRGDDEGPLTNVTLTRPFWMGRYEVTQREWEAIMDFNPSRFEGPDIAVHRVNWFQADDFCERLTQQERDAGQLPAGYVYRLPTEAEWEHAVRAGTQTRFFFGDDPNYTDLPDYAWYLPNQGGRVHEVGEKRPNPWGLYDVYGNVGEWCYDWKADQLPGGSVVDPTGVETARLKAVRGGHRGNEGYRLRSAWRRGAQIPTDPGSNFGYGFRVVLGPDLNQAPNQPPTVSLSSSGTEFTAPAHVELTAQAQDPDGQIETVEFWQGDRRVATDSDAPYQYTARDLTPGTYRYQARAIDTLGATGRSETIVIRVDEAPPSIVAATHRAAGYQPGRTMDVIITIEHPGDLTALGYEMRIPDGWSLASENSGSDIKPGVEQQGLLEWGWFNRFPQTTSQFRATLRVPAGVSGPQAIEGSVIARIGGPEIRSVANPNPLIIEETQLFHSADLNQDSSFSIGELLRVISLFNHTERNRRTGEYHVRAGTEDGYHPGNGSQTGAPHSADTNGNWRFGLNELLRLISLYNYSEGNQRTGEYHVQPGTEDGFAPGPPTRDRRRIIVRNGSSQEDSSLRIDDVDARWDSITNEGSSIVTLILDAQYTGLPKAAGWSLSLPAGWSFHSSSEATVSPTPGQEGRLDWAWADHFPGNGTPFQVQLQRSLGVDLDPALRADLSLVGPDHHEAQSLDISLPTPTTLTMAPIGIENSGPNRLILKFIAEHRGSGTPPPSGPFWLETTTDFLHWTNPEPVQATVSDGITTIEVERPTDVPMQFYRLTTAQ